MAIEAQEQAVFSSELHWISETETATEVAVKDDAANALAIVQSNFSRIAQSINQFWGSQQFDSYIEKLLIDERGGRRGFPPEVAEALLRLSRLHAQRFGFGAADDIWINADWRGHHS